MSVNRNNLLSSIFFCIKLFGIRSHHLMANGWGAVETVADFIFLVPKSLQMVTAAMKLKDTYSLEEKL